MLNDLSAEVHSVAKEKGWWDEPQPTFGEIIALCHAELSEALEEYRKNRPAEYHICDAESEEDALNNTVTICGEDGILACEYIYPENYPECPYYNAKPEGIAVELADCIIRILDYCGYADIDIDSIIRKKIEYNKTRPYRHGGKKL